MQSPLNSSSSLNTMGSPKKEDLGLPPELFLIDNSHIGPTDLHATFRRQQYVINARVKKYYPKLASRFHSLPTDKYRGYWVEQDYPEPPTLSEESLRLLYYRLSVHEVAFGQTYLPELAARGLAQQQHFWPLRYELLMMAKGIKPCVLECYGPGNRCFTEEDMLVVAHWIGKVWHRVVWDLRNPENQTPSDLLHWLNCVRLYELGKIAADSPGGVLKAHILFCVSPTYELQPTHPAYPLVRPARFFSYLHKSNGYYLIPEYHITKALGYPCGSGILHAPHKRLTLFTLHETSDCFICISGFQFQPEDLGKVVATLQEVQEFFARALKLRICIKLRDQLGQTIPLPSPLNPFAPSLNTSNEKRLVTYQKEMDRLGKHCTGHKRFEFLGRIPLNNNVTMGCWSGRDAKRYLISA